MNASVIGHAVAVASDSLRGSMLDSDLVFVSALIIIRTSNSSMTFFISGGWIFNCSSLAYLKNTSLMPGSSIRNWGYPPRCRISRTSSSTSGVATGAVWMNTLSPGRIPTEYSAMTRAHWARRGSGIRTLLAPARI